MSARGYRVSVRRGLKLSGFAFIFLAAFLLSDAPAGAAPQILGLAATGEPVPLHCANGTCKAMFSSFCLQKDRQNPGHGTPYGFADAQAVTLTFVYPDGGARQVAARNLLRIRSARGYSAVEISLDEAALEGAARAMVTVGEKVSLLPLTTFAGTSPIDAEEVARVSGHFRNVASVYFDGGSGPSGAARVLARVINSLEPYERMSAWMRGERWQTQVAAMAQGADPGAMALAETEFGNCQMWLEKGQAFGMRYCLENRHDALMRDLNIRYWNSLEPGS